MGLFANRTFHPGDPGGPGGSMGPGGPRGLHLDRPDRPTDPTRTFQALEKYSFSLFGLDLSGPPPPHGSNFARMTSWIITVL